MRTLDPYVGEILFSASQKLNVENCQAIKMNNMIWPALKRNLKEYLLESIGKKQLLSICMS